MDWVEVGDKKKIWRMIEHVANYQTPIKVTIPEKKTSFTSKLLKINYGSIAAGKTKGEAFIIKRIEEERKSIFFNSFKIKNDFGKNMPRSGKRILEAQISFYCFRNSQTKKASLKMIRKNLLVYLMPDLMIPENMLYEPRL